MKNCKPLPITKQESPFVTAKVRIEETELERVAKAMKYFGIRDSNNKTWQCRGLPYDHEMQDKSKVPENIKKTLIVSVIPRHFTS